MIRLFTALLDLLYPPKCPFCQTLLQKGEAHLCARCQRDLPWLSGPEAEQGGEYFALCVSPLRYQGAVRDSFHRYKFGGVLCYAPFYGTLMAQCAQNHLDGRWDLITWAPLSPKRRRKRGYDQAELLAQAMAKTLGTKALPLLRKTRHTDAQSGKTGDSARRANVLGVYQVTDPTRIAGKRVLLVDDIVTTGSTLAECARALCTAGAAEVVCATLARARK